MRKSSTRYRCDCVVVYNGRVEIFINLFPVANTDGLLELKYNEKAVPMNDFPSDNSVGDPFEVKGELFSCSKVTVFACPL